MPSCNGKLLKYGFLETINWAITISHTDYTPNFSFIVFWIHSRQIVQSSFMNSLTRYRNNYTINQKISNNLNWKWSQKVEWPILRYPLANLQIKVRASDGAELTLNRSDMLGRDPTRTRRPKKHRWLGPLGDDLRTSQFQPNQA